MTTLSASSYALPVSPADMAVIEALAAKTRKQRRSLPIKALVAIAFGLGAALCLAVEASVMFKVFDDLRGADIPGGESETALLAIGAGVMILGYHLGHHHFKLNPLMKWLGQASAFLIPVYFIGVGAMFVALNTIEGARFFESLPPLGIVSFRPTGAIKLLFPLRKVIYLSH